MQCGCNSLKMTVYNECIITWKVHFKKQEQQVA